MVWRITVTAMDRRHPKETWMRHRWTLENWTRARQQLDHVMGLLVTLSLGEEGNFASLLCHVEIESSRETSLPKSRIEPSLSEHLRLMTRRRQSNALFSGISLPGTSEPTTSDATCPKLPLSGSAEDGPVQFGT